MLTKQASESNRNVKTKVIVSSKKDPEEIAREKIWIKDGYFKDQVIDYIIKVNFPEICLLYIN